MWTMNNLPVVSTVHVPAGYAVILGTAKDVTFAPYHAGAFLHFGQYCKEHLPVAYHPLVDWALAQDPEGFWLRLDTDGDEYDELPRFDI